jgi:hypothetical protein
MLVGFPANGHCLARLIDGNVQPYPERIGSLRALHSCSTASVCIQRACKGSTSHFCHAVKNRFRGKWNAIEWFIPIADKRGGTQTSHTRRQPSIWMTQSSASEGENRYMIISARGRRTVSFDEQSRNGLTSLPYQLLVKNAHGPLKQVRRAT